jgi:hypothetical protein
LDGFIQDFFKAIALAILKTPARKPKPPKEAKKTATRHSGRLTEKVMKKPSKTAKELVQEALCKKLDGAGEQSDKIKIARATVQTL